jgi:hypothetical protein
MENQLLTSGALLAKGHVVPIYLNLHLWFHKDVRKYMFSFLSNRSSYDSNICHFTHTRGAVSGGPESLKYFCCQGYTRLILHMLKYRNCCIIPTWNDIYEMYYLAITHNHLDILQVLYDTLLLWSPPISATEDKKGLISTAEKLEHWEIARWLRKGRVAPL